MKTRKLMAYIASVCISYVIAYTAEMPFWCAGILSAGLMSGFIALDRDREDD